MRKAQNLNDQRIVEGYFNIIQRSPTLKSRLSTIRIPEEINFIHNLTLVTLRELVQEVIEKLLLFCCSINCKYQEKCIKSDTKIFLFIKVQI